MNESLIKPHHKTITLSAIVSVIVICGAIIPVAGVVLSPWLVGVMGRAMAGEIQDQARQQTLPLTTGFKVLIQANINRLQEEVDDLEFTQSDSRTKTSANAKKLASKRRELAEQVSALQAIRDAEKPRKRND